MPSLATGTNVFRPSEGTRGAASAALVSRLGSEAGDTATGSGTSAPATTNHHDAAIDPDGLGPGANGDPEPLHSQFGPRSSPPPPPSSPGPSPLMTPSQDRPFQLPAGVVLGSRSVSTSYPSATGTPNSVSGPSASSASKRKQSALLASQSNASASKKQRTTTCAVALNGIKESLDAFNNTLGRSLVMQQPDRGRADTSPERRAKAMDLLQEQESYLDDDRMVAFIDLFREDTAAADAYLALKRDSLRKKWVEKQLINKLGFPLVVY